MLVKWGYTRYLISEPLSTNSSVPQYSSVQQYSSSTAVEQTAGAQEGWGKEGQPRGTVRRVRPSRRGADRGRVQVGDSVVL